jgi:predicted PurR-regulated permease PerM
MSAWRTTISAMATRPDIALWILVGVAAIWLADNAAPILIPVVAAAVLATILNPLARLLERRLRLPNSLASAIPLMATLGLVFMALWLLLPATDKWQERIPSLISQAEFKLLRITSLIEDVTEATQKVTEAASTGIGADKSGNGKPETVVVQQEPGFLSGVLSEAPAAMAQTLIILVLAFFFLHERQAIVRLIVGVFVHSPARFRVARFCRTARRNIAHYFLTICAINLGLGLLTGLLFHLIGMPEPASWGGAMALANFVPFIGPAVIFGLSFVVALVTYPTFELALMAPTVILGVNLVEANLIMPTLVGRRFYTSPVLVLLAVLFGAWLWGAIGAIVAVPLTVIAVSGLRSRALRVARG